MATDTDKVERDYRRERRRKYDEREKSSEGRMTASEFARMHELNAFVFRRKLRAAGYNRRGRYLIPIKDLEKFLPEE